MGKSNEENPLERWRSEPGSQRRYQRLPLHVPASVTAPGLRHRGTIRDLSPDGALVSLRDSTSLSTGAQVYLTPTGYRTISGEIRRVLDGGRRVGLMLKHDAEEQAELARWLDSLRAPARRPPETT